MVFIWVLSTCTKLIPVGVAGMDVAPWADASIEQDSWTCISKGEGEGGVALQQRSPCCWAGSEHALQCFGTAAFYCTGTSTVQTREWEERQSQMLVPLSVMESTVQVRSDAKVVVLINSYSAEPSPHWQLSLFGRLKAFTHIYTENSFISSM